MSDKTTNCEWCDEEFEPTAVQLWKHRNGHSAHLFCSRECRVRFYRNSIEMECAICQKPVTRPLSEFKKSKSGNIYCSQSCSSVGGNYAVKKKPDTASRMERFLQKQIELEFPEVSVVYNSNDIIGCELDIYFPDFKAALEISGPEHFGPIRGSIKKFLNTLQNDARKAKWAKEKGITVFVLNTSGLRFGKAAQERYWPQVKKLIEALIKINQSP